MSGHNRWTKIKRLKGATDAARGRAFTKVIKEITIAARTGGGDPSGNPRLRKAIDLAKGTNMPNETWQRAIKKGTGELEGASYEELVYEGVGPGGALLLMEVVTDNRNRTAAEIRKIFDKHNGQLGGAGSAAWAFVPKGIITIPKAAATEEQLFDVAVGAGAEDVGSDDETWTVTTPPDQLEPIKDALSGAKITVTTATLEKVAKTPKIVGGRDGEVLVNLATTLEEHDDIQKVYTDFELSEADAARLAGEA